jgi:hypothetical protein
MVAVEDAEAGTEDEAIEVARIKIREWLDQDVSVAYTLIWVVEHEDA